MESDLHVSTTVLRGNKIEIETPGLKEGDPVDLFVFPAQSGQSPRTSALKIIESLNGHRLFPSVEDVDRYLRQEREAWDRSGH